MALALYRRYRPDTFDGVVGQDQVVVPLMRALDEGKLTHAYLFSGPRGCGKTSSARILARCVNCAKGPTSHPCGECESCKDLATGGPGSIDVVEIDAASHNGVDDARELRERAGFAPARDRYKIFILDEAHMVTPQGFNALLKIVEEPPEHVMFIFATTEPDKVIGTIRSRTHHYPFRLVPQEVMGPYLEQLCQKEGIKPEPGVLKLAMRAGGGSMRDTLSVLDQLMVGSVDGVITHDASVALLGFTPEALIGEAIDAVIDRNGEALYGVVQKVVVGGFDPRRFVEDLLARVRDLLVLTLAGDRAENVLSDSAEGEDMADLHRQASALGLGALTAMADTINATLGSMTGAISPRMRLELLAARLLAGREQGASATGGVSAEPVVAEQQPAAQSGGFAGAPRNQAPQQGGGFAGAARNQKNDVASGEVSQSQPSAPTEHDIVAAAPAAAVTETPAAEDNRTPDQKWDALVNALPEDVRRYVSRDKVLRIKYAPANQPGKMRLWLKFDTALSKYAFALAVAGQEVDGTNKVVNILRAEVRKMFGEHTDIAPTKTTDDGERTPAFKDLPANEQQRIKAQLLQENLQAAGAMKSGGEASGESGTREQSSTAGAHQDEGSPDDEESHRADGEGAAESKPAGQTSAPGIDDDPWAIPPQQTAVQQEQPSAAQSEERHEKHVAVHDMLDDDPWAVPPQQTAVQQGQPSAAQSEEHHEKHVAVHDMLDDDPWAVPPQQTAVQQEQLSASQSQESHEKRVAVPDISDNDDPWAVPPAVPAQPAQSDAQNRPAESAGVADNHAPQAQDDEDPWQQPVAPPVPVPEPTPSGETEPAPDPWNMPAEPRQPAPEVPADEDEYSMSDESLGSATAMSVDDVKKLFEVKKVEEFGPDDPKNPRNMHSASKHTEE
ncbi:DNA polymerase III subunit gamma/tau [Bifidobacterium panos]|uniref:DNA-directed DNA polymerase n=1 Tax=Bifidobacterium panos TaxID=2675321 RepID=A0ABX1SZ99_9BIFI|nr:DNA polymerase III subunit gamma/tau [Bifidobacterium sp. DSM 109963]NMN01934.1 DNA polymerase III subunit gamma/tau [Bifidobacterium sp. DSM 109963]